MDYWRWLVHGLETTGAADDKEAARGWIAKNLGFGFSHDDELNPGPTAKEWRSWTRNAKALLWLARHRGRKKRVRMPSFVRDAVNDALRTVTLRARSELLQDGIVFDLAEHTEATPNGFVRDSYPWDPYTIWRAAFLNYFGLIQEQGFCIECGQPIPQTQKTNNKSKSRFCSIRCRVRDWRRQHANQGKGE